MPDLHSIPGFADPFSSLSHLLGAIVFAVLGFVLVAKGRRSPWERRGRVASLAVFSVSAVVLLAMSATFHMLARGGPRLVFQRLDHAAIFVLIAGTFTPIHTIMFRGFWRWGTLAFLWLVAVAGVTLKSLYFASVPESLGTFLYIGMGWLGVGTIFVLARRHGVRFVAPMALGGLAYTIGALIDLGKMRPPVAGVIRAHEVFHVAVLLGLSLHWRFVWRIAGGSGYPHAPRGVDAYRAVARTPRGAWGYPIGNDPA